MGGPRGAQEAHRARPRGRGPRIHASPRRNMWGATWQVGLADGGPTGIVGPGKRVGAVTQIILCLRFPYLTASFPNVFSVWDYVPTRVLPCRTRGGTADGGSTGIA